MRSYTRHQLKQDRFAETITEQVSWVVEHRSKLIAGGIAVALILVAVIGGWFLVQYRDQQASAKLGHAMRTYEAPLRAAGAPAEADMQSFTSSAERAKAANAEFTAIANQYSRTQTGKIARYFAGVTATDMGDYPAAEKFLKEVGDGGDKDLGAMAKFALASVYRNTNRDADAVKLYKELADHPSNSVPKSTAQLELAALYEAKGQAQDAARIYEEIRKSSPNTAAAELANTRLGALK